MNQGRRDIFGVVNNTDLLYLAKNRMRPGRCSKIDVFILDVLTYYINLPLYLRIIKSYRVGPRVVMKYVVKKMIV